MSRDGECSPGGFGRTGKGREPGTASQVCRQRSPRQIDVVHIPPACHIACVFLKADPKMRVWVQETYLVGESQHGDNVGAGHRR